MDSRRTSLFDRDSWGISMKQKNTVVTLALLGVLALAALAGGLLPAGNAVHAAEPEFDDTDVRTVAENTPPGVNIGNPVSASDDDDDGEGNNDIEFGDTLTYSLSGTDAASFDIDASTGQLITKAPLDFENPGGGTGSDTNAYVVTVTVKDSSSATVTRNVTINVTNVAEEPSAPAAPTVVSTDLGNDPTTYDLKVIWYAPDDTGDRVTGYDVQYKKSTDASFTDHTHTDTSTSTEIEDLDADTSYQVRVRAKDGNNDSDLGPWSISSVGSTNKKDNDLPTFGDGNVERHVLENAEPGLVVGSKVSATDDDNVIPLAYQLLGPDASSFDLQASTGQIRTKRGVVYDFETKPTLNVTMTVSDGQGGTDATAVTISVTDTPEAPSKPDRPTVRATEGSSRSLDVSWKEPDNTGPAITGYDLRYRKGNSGNFTVQESAGTGTTATIAPTDDNLEDGDGRLSPGSSYEVYVRAKSLEAPVGGEWSAAGTGRTSAGNREPLFGDRSSLTESDPTTTRTVTENTRAGQPVGRAVAAQDGNGDRRTYRLVAAPSPNAAHVSNFDINESTGQILTKEPLNHEDAACGYDPNVDTSPNNDTTCTYTVVVQVWDGLDEHRNEQDAAAILNDGNEANDDEVIDDTITVTITVSDVAEKPAAPTVTVTSSTVLADATTAMLTVTWDRPENMGPAITEYEVECTGDGITTANPCPQPAGLTLTAAVLTYDIESLTPNKPYRVRVRAKNAEGDGVWSSWVTQSTSKAGNSLPTFDVGLPGTLQVEENAPSPQQPLTTSDGTVTTIPANDTDGDTLTLRLEGPGAGRFQIDRTGQIKTRSKLNHEDSECGYNSADENTTTSCSYRVRVKASDPNGGSASHALTINVEDELEPPAKPTAPRVTATAGSGWSLEVTWNEPRNDGPPHHRLPDTVPQDRGQRCYLATMGPYRDRPERQDNYHTGRGQ